MKRLLLFYLFAIFILFACKEDEDVVASDTEQAHIYKVAVIVPSARTHWEKTAEWALENIRESQKKFNEPIDLKLVWIDESSSFLANRMKSVLNDSSIVAVVGPISSAKAKVLAGFDVAQQKPVILPCATSSDLRRMYANCDYIWNLTANDIEELKAMLMLAQFNEAQRIHLLARDDEYGETFLSWTAFMAEQMGIEMGGVESYRSTDEEVELFKEIVAQDEIAADMLFFVPSSVEDELVLDAYISTLSADDQANLPSILCSDEFTSKNDNVELYTDILQGLALSATPESSFDDAYLSYFGYGSSSGEAQLYDSFVLLSLALAHMEANGGTLNESIQAVARGHKSEMSFSNQADLTEIFRAIKADEQPVIVGNSGRLNFKEGSTSVEGSTYRYWALQEHEPLTMGYVFAGNSDQTTDPQEIYAAVGSSEYVSSGAADSTLVYPATDQCWALLVAGTSGWENYRHQADVYAMYQLLRRHGYARDHIIVIAEDDIAHNIRNPYPGVVRVLPDGENVYQDMHINYALSSLKPSDLKQILCGEATYTLKEVFPANYDDNIFIYWCGEGGKGVLEFGNQIITANQMASYLQAMSDKSRYRKLFFALEACYSGSIGQSLEGIPGLLCMTAANPSETSKADVCDPQLGVWLSNGFTRGFLSAVEENPNISFLELYYKLATSTWGSHVCVYNETNFGALANDRMREFLPE